MGVRRGRNCYIRWDHKHLPPFPSLPLSFSGPPHLPSQRFVPPMFQVLMHTLGMNQSLHTELTFSGGHETNTYTNKKSRNGVL